MKLNKKFIVPFLALIVLVSVFVTKLNQKIQINYYWLSNYEAEIDSVEKWKFMGVVGESIEHGIIGEYVLVTPKIAMRIFYGIKQKEILSIAIFFTDRLEEFYLIFEDFALKDSTRGSEAIFSWASEKGFFDKSGLPMRVKEIFNFSLNRGGR